MASKRDPSTANTRNSGAARPTLKTIASITELGTTTVSRALKDAPDIGKKTKQRVREVAQQIGYIPNRAGVGLRTGKTNVISLVLSLDEEIMGLTSHMVRGVSEALSSTPYHLTITPYTEDQSPLDAIRYIVEHRTADGIIMSRTEPHDERVGYLHSQRIPFATHGRTLMDIDHPFHDFDNKQFAADATRQLLERNRSRIALLAPPDSVTFYHHAFDGYKNELRAHSLEPWPSLPCTIDHKLDFIENQIKHVFQQKHRPDGIISMSGGSTIALTCGIEAAGLVVGRDVDIVSKQNMNILSRFRPEIVTIDEDIHQAGRELAKAVIGSIRQTPHSELQTIAYPSIGI
ncbi:LacI family transcriptional regulator [Chromatiales bacterium (ex Bugula neritina AB1)]|nr:LacI family transcriptional regulator [Chromatiales bacterium (ex Bugula neritina AB1)]